MSHACPRFWTATKPSRFWALLGMCTIPCTCHARRHLNVQTWMLCTRLFFALLTSKCASRHNGVHFLHISTSKCSEPGLLCTWCWLGNMLRATTACTFSTSRLPKVHRSWCVLPALTWKYASRHNGLRFFNISTSKSAPNLVSYTFWLRNVLRATTACNFRSLIWPDGSAPAALASLLFDPPEPQIIRKTQCFPTFLPFPASASSFFWLFLFSDLLSSTLLFSSLTLPTSAFSSVIICPYCRKFDF